MHLPVLRAALGRDDISDDIGDERTLLIREIWGRCGEMWGDVRRYGEIWGDERALVRGEALLVGEVWGRCRGDAGEIWRRYMGRCSGDIGERYVTSRSICWKASVVEGSGWVASGPARRSNLGTGVGVWGRG